MVVGKGGLEFVVERRKYTELAACLFCIIAVAILVWLIFEYAIGIVIPFIIAFCVGVPIYKLSCAICTRSQTARKLCAFVLVVVLLALLGAVVFWAFNRLMTEVEELIKWLGENDESVGGVVGVVFGYVSDVSSKIPFIEALENIEGLEDLRVTIDEGISGMIGDFVSGVTSSIPSRALSIIKGAPKIIITVLVTILSCFYFAMDYDGLKSGILNTVSERSRRGICSLGEIVCSAVKRYARAYLFIMLLTFTEVFIGLLLLGQRYAFLLAFVVAVVDILPVFGAGTVLVPWAVVSLLIRDLKTGLGLIVLYGVITIIRQVAEPKIIGESLGIHPLVTLFAMFVGLSLFGIPGMLLGPAFALVAKEIIKQKE